MKIDFPNYRIEAYKPPNPTTPAAQRQDHAASTTPQDKVTLTPQLRTGIDNVRSLGMLVLGGEKAIDEWEKRGLIITDETLQAAYEVFNDAFRDSVKNNTNGFGFNRHQIVANSQPVPEWFLVEQEAELAAMENKDARDAFMAGKLYYSTSNNSPATDTYRRIYNA